MLISAASRTADAHAEKQSRMIEEQSRAADAAEAAAKVAAAAAAETAAEAVAQAATEAAEEAAAEPAEERVPAIRSPATIVKLIGLVT